MTQSSNSLVPMPFLLPAGRRLDLLSKLKSRGIQDPILKLHDNQLEQVTEYKYLGVTITNTLSWSAHISSISSKARKLAGITVKKEVEISNSLVGKSHFILLPPWWICVW